jgi:hypothetical protein
MSEKIYAMRYLELEPALAAKLWPFVNSYRPHDSVQLWRQLRGEGYEPIEKESTLDELNDYYFEMKGYYPEDNPELVDVPRGNYE